MRILNTDKQSIDAGRKERGKSKNCRAEEKENNNTNGKRENEKVTREEVKREETVKKN